MSTQKLTLNIRKITLNSNLNGRRLEAALSQELAKLLGSPEMIQQLGASRTIESSVSSLSQKKGTNETELGANIARSVAGILTS